MVVVWLSLRVTGTRQYLAEAEGPTDGRALLVRLRAMPRHAGRSKGMRSPGRSQHLSSLLSCHAQSSAPWPTTGAVPDLVSNDDPARRPNAAPHFDSPQRRGAHRVGHRRSDARSWATTPVVRRAISGHDAGLAMAEAVQWLPPVLISIAIAWTGMNTIGRVLAAIATLLGLWIVPAVLAAVSTIGYSPLFGNPLEKLEWRCCTLRSSQSRAT